jgi:predicted acyl esterase
LCAAFCDGGRRVAALAALVWGRTQEDLDSDAGRRAPRRHALHARRPEIRRTCAGLLEYLPYRKDDDEAIRDYGTHAYFARRGYVGARVDIRGFGASEGHAARSGIFGAGTAGRGAGHCLAGESAWSNGKVGMLGISWGGFNSIQMALRKPPALKAILAVAATEELFKEDVHYMDGVFHVDEFELTMDLDQGRPGAPDFSLDESVIGRA